MGLRTPLFATHVAAGARMVDFGGWDMPVNYGSQIDEHHAVRCGAGMFDVSHMCVIDLTGTRVREFLRNLLANDVARLQAPGKALYSCMLNERGGVIDDLIVYFLNEQFFRVVVNAGTRDKDIAWIRQHAANFAVTVQVRDDLAMIAVQGPQARATVATVLAQPAVLDIPVFTGCAFDDRFVARTGYTGEDGFEIMLPATVAAGYWARLQAAGVALCGLGARDTLRLEAGMNLYGNDMDENQSPLESGLAWTVVFDPPERSFIGRAALDAQRAQGVARKLVGLVLEERGVLRAHQTVLVDDLPAGEITSGSFAPTLERSIALARVPAHTSGVVKVDIRGKALPARIVKYPFVRHGKALVAL